MSLIDDALVIASRGYWQDPKDGLRGALVALADRQMLISPERAQEIDRQARAEVRKQISTEIDAAIERNRAEHPDEDAMIVRRLGMRAAWRLVVEDGRDEQDAALDERAQATGRLQVQVEQLRADAVRALDAVRTGHYDEATALLARMADDAGKDTRKGESTRCTCARSWGLHSKECARYVPGHELAAHTGESTQPPQAPYDAGPNLAECDCTPNTCGHCPCDVCEDCHACPCLCACDEDTVPAEYADSPAARLAEQLLASQPDVELAEVADATTVRLHVRPTDLDGWRWYLARFQVPPGSITYRGPYATARGHRGEVQVLLAGLGVPALEARARNTERGERP